MAILYTVAGLQTVLDEVEVHVLAEGWEAAKLDLVRAKLILAGLPSEFSGDGAVIKMADQISEVTALLEGLETASKSGGDRRRMIRTGLSHGR